MRLVKLLFAFPFLAATIGLPAQAQSTGRAAGSGNPVDEGSSAGASSEGLQVTAIDGPEKTYAGEPVTYTAIVEREGLSSPVTYQWRFREDSPESETAGPAVEMFSKHLVGQSRLVATHTYDQPGTYTVKISAGQGEEKARASATVTVTDSSSPDSDDLTPIASTQAPQDAQSSNPAEVADRSGKWGIVVASMRYVEKAEIIAEQHRSQFQAERMPVEIMKADLKDGRHFRVVMGRFKSEKAARTAISSHRERLPVRAWTVQYQERFLSEAGP